MKASDKLDYSPSRRRAAWTVAALGAWTIFAGVVLGTTGAFYIDPGVGDVEGTPGTAIGIVLGLFYIYREIPDL